MSIISVKEMVNELMEFYSLREISTLTGISVSTLTRINRGNHLTLAKNEEKLRIFFRQHVLQHMENVSIKELVENNDSRLLIDTPDDLQHITRLIVKQEKICKLIKTKSCSLEASATHLVESTNEGWIAVEDVKPGTILKTVFGDEGVISIKDTGTKKVYDITVDHPNHRYWAGGLSNHNCGKSYIALATAAKAQQAGKQIVIFDSEFAIDHEFASNLGLDTSKIIYFPVKTIEQCKNAVYKFLSNVHDLGLVGQFFIVIDSLGAMISEMDYKRMEKNSDSKDMGSYAGSMKALIKACNSLAGMTQTTIICTNHIYDDPGAMFTSLVKPMPGGKIVRYLPTTIVQLSANNVKGTDKNGKGGDDSRKIFEVAQGGSHGEVGIEVRGLGVKNRICKPLNEAYMYISFENGLSKYYGLMDLACALGALKNVGGRIRDAETDEFYGFSKDIQFDAEFWEGFIDKLQPYVEKAWHYKTEAERRAAIKKDVEIEQEIMNED